MALQRLKVVIGCAVAYGLWRYFKATQALHDVRAYQETKVPYYPHLSTSRLDEFVQYDGWSHSQAVASMEEFSRLYQESFLADSPAKTIVCRLQSSRARCMRHLYALKDWLPNDVRLMRRLIACAEETDAAMATAIEEVSRRRGVEGLEPHAGRLRFWDQLGVRASNDSWT